MRIRFLLVVRISLCTVVQIQGNAAGIPRGALGLRRRQRKPQVSEQSNNRKSRNSIPCTVPHESLSHLLSSETSSCSSYHHLLWNNTKLTACSPAPPTSQLRTAVKQLCSSVGRPRTLRIGEHYILQPIALLFSSILIANKRLST